MGLVGLGSMFPLQESKQTSKENQPLCARRQKSQSAVDTPTELLYALGENLLRQSHKDLSHLGKPEQGPAGASQTLPQTAALIMNPFQGSCPSPRGS